MLKESMTAFIIGFSIKTSAFDISLRQRPISNLPIWTHQQLSESFLLDWVLFQGKLLKVESLWIGIALGKWNEKFKSQINIVLIKANDSQRKMYLPFNVLLHENRFRVPSTRFQFVISA